MIYGAIDYKSEDYYTDLNKVFDAINNVQKNYNWLITDCETNRDVDERLNREYCWISGEDLTNLVSKEDFQWIWAVLSAFDKNVELSEVLKYDLPYANGYGGFWKKPLTLQHPLAQIEIVPWDSTLTLILGKNKDIIDSFINFYPDSEYLEDYLDKS